MIIWLITIGEPVPLSVQSTARLHRAGQFALWASKKSDVTWWTSAFDHVKKEFISAECILQLQENLKIRLFRGSGYRKNISLGRIYDQSLLAKKIFKGMQAVNPPPDIILCSVPPIELASAAVRYGKETGVPVVLDLRDMWPDIFVDHSPYGFKAIARTLLAPFFRQAKMAFSAADALIGITEGFLNWGLQKAGRSRIAWDESFPFAYTALSPQKDRLVAAAKSWDQIGVAAEGKPFRFCFFGALSNQFDIPTVIRASNILRDAGVRAQFVICGDGDRLKYFRKLSSGNEDVIFPGWVDAAAIHVLMRRSSAGISPLPNRYDFLATINNKSVEYLSAGLPILSCPAEGTLASFLNKYACGLSFNYGDANSLAKLISELIKDQEKLQRMSKNAAKAFEDNFVAEKVNGNMFAHLERIVSEYRGTVKK